MRSLRNESSQLANCVDRVLKQQLQRKLDLSRRIRRANRPKGRVCRLRIGHSEICVIQQIKELRTELQVDAFANQKVLVSRKIPLLETGRAEGIPAHVRHRAQSREAL